MLRITIPATELWDELSETFIYTKEQTLQLEHSLVSLSKWESKWNKPFFSKEEKTIDETLDYIKCMTITQNVDPKLYNNLTNDNIRQVNDYIDSSMTATTFSKSLTGKTSREIVTSELIYYWMIALDIPLECQKWHINRLFTLIRVCNVKNQPAKKTSQKELVNRYAELNRQRRAKLNSKG